MLGEFGDEAQKAIDAFKNGSPVVQESEVNFDAATSEESSAVEEPNFSMDADYGEPSQEDQPEVENSEEVSEEKSEETSSEDIEDSVVEDSQSDTPDIEYIQAEGKKIKIDYSDREKTKRAYQMAAGMRKFQAERDTYKKQLDEQIAKGKDNQDIIDKCDAVIDDDEALFRLITGGRELSEIVEAKMAERDELAAMSPEQLDAYKKNQDFEKRERELKKREEALKAKAEEADNALSTSERNRQQTMVNSAFTEHRFAGKFGDPSREARADRMLWKDVVERLSEYDSVNQELINQVVAEAAEDMRSLINIQAQKQIKKQVKKQKQVSTKKAQEAVFDGDATKKQELQSKIKDGDYTSALGGLLGGDYSFFK